MVLSSLGHTCDNTNDIYRTAVKSKTKVRKGCHGQTNKGTVRNRQEKIYLKILHWLTNMTGIEVHGATNQEMERRFQVNNSAMPLYLLLFAKSE